MPQYPARLFDTPTSVRLPLAEQEARRQRMAQRMNEARQAMRLYAIDNTAARQRGHGFPKIHDYVVDTWVDGPREIEATEYAKSRFHELPTPKPARKRTESADAKARRIQRERSRRREMA